MLTVSARLRKGTRWSLSSKYTAHVRPTVGHDVYLHLQFLPKAACAFSYILKQNLLTPVYSLNKITIILLMYKLYDHGQLSAGFFNVRVACPATEWLQAARLFHFSCIFFNSLSPPALVVKLSVSCHFILLSVSLPLPHPQFDGANLLSAEKSDNQDL